MTLLAASAGGRSGGPVQLRWFLWLVLVAGALLRAVAARADEAPETVGLASTTLVFASVEQARVALAEDDAWLRATSAFQRAATMREPVDGATPTRFQDFLRTTALPWSPAEKARWLPAVRSLAPRLAALPLDWPLQVLLVHTDGRDAAGAPYTRGNTIFLPRGLATPGYSDGELLAHELFHVLTRHRPELAARLYAELGFEPITELAWPVEWLAARIANPDAPHSRHAMRTDVHGESMPVVPLLVARRTALQPGETFFDVLDVRLLAVQPGSGSAPTQALRRADGQPLWLPVGEAPAYLRRLGGNTRYVFHPEETAADNFAFLLSGRQVPNPGLLSRFEQILRTNR